MIIYCDECKYEFELTDEIIKSKKVKGMTVQYFECEACGKKYITRCFNEYMHKEQRRLKKIKDEIEGTTNEIEKALLRVSYQACLKNLAIQNDRLKLEAMKVLR